MSSYKDEIITVRFDKEMMKEYSGFDVENPDVYFKLRPRAKRVPFEALHGKQRMGLIPSINKFLNVPSRIIQNQWEIELKNYCTYTLNRQRVKAAYLNECVALVVQYKPTASKSDNSNIYEKPFLDAMVEHEIMVDDNYLHVQFYSTFSVVDKKDPHSEIILFPITDEYPFEIAMMELTNHVMELRQKYEQCFKKK